MRLAIGPIREPRRLVSGLMAKGATCREQILNAISAIQRRSGQKTVGVQEIVDELRREGSSYKESTIRTHITSSMCVNAPPNHAVRYADLFRVERGVYKLADE